VGTWKKLSRITIGRGCGEGVHCVEGDLDNSGQSKELGNGERELWRQMLSANSG